MLRSSIKALRHVWSSPAEQALGIAIGRRQLTVASIAASGGRPVCQWTRALAAPEGLFSGRPASACAGALADALARLVPEARQRYVPVHVAVPDPLGRIAVFDLDGVPAGERLRLQLVRWRTAKEAGLAEAELEAGYQDLGSENQKRLLLGQVINAEWLACIKTALTAAAIAPWSVNQAVCFRFNAFHARFAAAGRSAALLALDPDAWTIAAWTADARLRFVRSRWRDPVTGAPSEFALIAEDFERAILAYVHGNKGRTVDDIYISAGAAELDALAAILNARLQAPCVPLAPDMDGAAAATPSGLTDLALVTALA